MVPGALLPVLVLACTMRLAAARVTCGTPTAPGTRGISVASTYSVWAEGYPLPVALLLLLLLAEESASGECIGTARSSAGTLPPPGSGRSTLKAVAAAVDGMLCDAGAVAAPHGDREAMHASATRAAARWSSPAGASPVVLAAPPASSAASTRMCAGRRGSGAAATPPLTSLAGRLRPAYRRVSLAAAATAAMSSDGTCSCAALPRRAGNRWAMDRASAAALLLVPSAGAVSLLVG